MFHKLSIAEAASRGIRYSSKVELDTGEVRARVSVPGADVTLTNMPTGGGWQSSHRHERVVEHTMVIIGSVIVAEKTLSGEITFRLRSEGESFSTHPGLSHNLFVPAGTLLSTLKINDNPDARDWIEDPDLDALTRHLTLEEALARTHEA